MIFLNIFEKAWREQYNEMNENEMIAMEPEWDLILSQFPIGTKICGKIIDKRQFGVFIEVEVLQIKGSIIALLEILRISESSTETNKIFGDFKVGDTVCAVVIWLEAQSGIKLSTRKSEFEKYGYSGGY